MHLKGLRLCVVVKLQQLSGRKKTISYQDKRFYNDKSFKSKRKLTFDNGPDRNSQLIQDTDNIPQSEGSTLNTQDVLISFSRHFTVRLPCHLILVKVNG